MWGRKRKAEAAVKEPSPASSPLKEALHQARVEAAERTSVVVDLRDAEVARLELLSEALDPLFADIPSDVDLFDRGISRGETPRLWIDTVAHIATTRDKRGYRFLHDSRMGRHVIAESHDIPDIVQAVTTYVARRLVERQQALAAEPVPGARAPAEARPRRGRFWRVLGVLAVGFILGVVVLLAAALLLARS